MKTISRAVDFVQNEMDDPRHIMFRRTKSQLFFTLLTLFLTAEIGLYMLTRVT